MKKARVLFIVLTVASASGCSGLKNVRCHGVFRHEMAQNVETNDKAVFGFNILRALPIVGFVSPKDSKGFVSFSYDPDPYGDSYPAGNILAIKESNAEAVSAGEVHGESGESLIYQPIDGVVRYEDKRSGSIKSFSGVCQQEVEAVVE